MITQTKKEFIEAHAGQVKNQIKKGIMIEHKTRFEKTNFSSKFKFKYYAENLSIM